MNTHGELQNGAETSSMLHLLNLTEKEMALQINLPPFLMSFEEYKKT